MTATQVEKQQFQNNLGGWVGVVIIGPKGDDRGISVEPDGTVWLSEAEQRLTANAPRLPKDNPFIEQTHVRRNEETGELEEWTVTPLTPCSEERWVPADSRPIPATMPGPMADQLAQMAARADEPTTVTTASGDPVAERDAEVMETVQPRVPPRAARAAAAAGASTEATEMEEVAQEAPGTYEETGAAVPPTGDAPEGEYGAHEEVGTPVQETADDDGEGDAPPPWQE